MGSFPVLIALALAAGSARATHYGATRIHVPWGQSEDRSAPRRVEQEEARRPGPHINRLEEWQPLPGAQPHWRGVSPSFVYPEGYIRRQTASTVSDPPHLQPPAAAATTQRTPTSTVRIPSEPEGILQNLPPGATVIHTGNRPSGGGANHTIILAPIETDPASALPPLFAITQQNWERLDDLGGLTKSEVAKLLITLLPFLVTIIYVPLFVLTLGVLTLPVIRVDAAAGR